MKKAVLFLLVMLSVFAVSCASKDEVDTKDMPEWFLNVPVAEDAYYASGMYKSQNPQMAITAATSQARDEIARQVSLEVSNAVKSYAQEAGVDGDSQVINFIETVSKQIADTTLVGSKVIEKHLSKDGTVYVLVMYEKSALKDSALSEFQRNESAAFAEFKAAEAMKWLDKELESE
ncbi:MAG: LPP20 family lipoprotein [Spirochaetales bacterium]|nr:LPP20 family lipoprotein [Spirochaetales bacterium]